MFGEFISALFQHDDVVLGGLVHLKIEAGEGQTVIVGDDGFAVAVGHGQSVDVAVPQRFHGGADIGEFLDGDGIRQLFVAKVHLQGGSLGAHGLAREIFRLGPFALVFLDGDDGLLGLVISGIIVIREVVVFRTLGGVGEAGDGHVHGAGLHGGLAGVKAHGLDHQLTAHFLGDVLGQRHIEADILVLARLGGIHKLHGSKVRGNGDGQGGLPGFLLGAAAKAANSQQQGGQQQSNDLLHCHIPSSFIIRSCTGLSGTEPSIHE